MLIFIENWLKNLIVIIILISMVRMILPSGRLKSYIRFILSLVVMLLIVQPFVEVVKGSDYLIEGLLQVQNTLDFEEARIETMVQTINNQQDAIKLYKQKIVQQLEHELSVLTSKVVVIESIEIIEDENNKEFGYVTSIDVKVESTDFTEAAQEVMLSDEKSSVVQVESQISKWLKSNYGSAAMRINISLESGG